MASQSDTMSPDPLALSLDEPTDRKPDIKPSPRPITPTRTSRPSNGNVRLQDFYLTTPQAALLRTSSPTRSMAQTENLLSPWRIRVRVEAERSDAPSALKRSSPSPVRRVGQWTKTTTTIPTKSADDSLLPSGKRPRGRPRKSTDGPIKRKGTPKPKRSTKRTAVEKEDDNPQEPAAEQAAPSERSKAHAKPTLELDCNELPHENQDSEPERDSKKRGRPRRSKNTQYTTAVGRTHKETKAVSPVQKPDNAKAHHISNATNTVAPQMQGQIPANELNQSFSEAIEETTKSPSRAPKRKRVIEKADSLAEQSNGSMTSEPQSSIKAPTGQEGAGNYLKAQRRNLENSENHMDPSNEQKEFDSIIESEGFSMVSMSTLPSAKQNFMVSPVREIKNSMEAAGLESHFFEGHTGQLADRKGGPGIKSLDSPRTASLEAPEPNPTDGLRDGSVSTDDAPNSKPLSAKTYHVWSSHGKDHTSAKEYVPSSIPLPPDRNLPRESSRPVNLLEDGSSNIIRTHRAGSALQGVVQPSRISSSEPIDTDQSTRNRFMKDPGPQLRGFGSGIRRHLREGLQLGEELETKSSSTMNADDRKPRSYLPPTVPSSKFSGFGTGTRRELKAGLRLGEELIKRQRLMETETSKETYTMDDEFPDLSTVKKPKLLTPSESDIASQSHKQGEVVYPEMSAHHRQQANEVRYPNLPSDQLMSPERSNDHNAFDLESNLEASVHDSDIEDRMSWKADIMKQTGNRTVEDVPLPHPLPLPRSENYEEVWARREAEWQREREAVSLQIQQANQSQVIVIDSSIIADRSKVSERGEDEKHALEVGRQLLEDEDFDIWQSEANNSKNIAKRPRHDTSAGATEVLFPEAQIRPRRSKLPSPWRRQSSSNIIYSEHPSTDPDPFLPSPEKREPTTPLQPHKRQASQNNCADFSNVSDFGRPIDECATVQFKRPRLVQSVEDKIPIAMEEEEIPDDGNHLNIARRDSPDMMYLDPASQLYRSSPSIIRHQRVSDTIAGAKDSFMVDPAPALRGRREPSGRPLLPGLQAAHHCQSLAQNSSQASTCDPAQSPTRSSSPDHDQSSSHPSDETSSTSSRAQSIEQSPLPQRLAQPSVRSQATPSAQSPTYPLSAISSQILTSIKPFLSSFMPAQLPLAIPSVTTQIAASSPPSPPPFTLHHPWTNAHYLVLQPLYLKERTRRHVSSYDPESSPSSFLLGKMVRSHGWSKTIEPWELGVVDAFMAVLFEGGVVTLKAERPKLSGWWSGFKETIDAIVGRDGIRSWEELSKADMIDEVEVVKRVFSLWVGRVQRGEEDLGEGVAGSFDKRYRARGEVLKGRV